jgi:DNA-binding LacI/PurR family transcriptional regulator
VAKLANTSKSTVSRYLNGHRVKKETEERIKKAIEELNYHRNENARRLVTHKTQTIGIVVDSITNFFYPSIFSGIEEIANESGLECVFYSRSPDKKESDYLDIYFQRQADGLIFINFKKRDEEDLAKIVKSEVPAVVIGDDAGLDEVVSVDVNNYFGISSLVKYLNRIGHKKIAYISGPDNFSATESRLLGFIETMEQLGNPVDPDLIVKSDWTNQGGYQAMTQLLATGDFTAVVASNDETAIGALRALNEQGFIVPDHISVTGFDDIAISSWVFPMLTTVKQPFYEMGVKAVAELLEMISREIRWPGKRLLMKPTLKIRNSCKALQS